MVPFKAIPKASQGPQCLSTVEALIQDRSWLISGGPVVRMGQRLNRMKET